MSLAVALLQFLACSEESVEEFPTSSTNMCLTEDVKFQYEFPDEPVVIPTTVHRFINTDFERADYPLAGTDFSPEGTIARQFYDLQQYVLPYFQIDVVDDQIHEMEDQETVDETLDEFSEIISENYEGTGTAPSLSEYWDSLGFDNPDTIDVVYLERDAGISVSISELNSGAMFMTSDDPYILAHEFGHGVFGLPHTFETEIKAYGGEFAENDGLERVDGSNATYAGDWQSDTPADFPDSEKQCVVNDSDPDHVQIACTLGAPRDPNGDDYTPDPQLIMSYFPAFHDINNLYFSDGELQTGLCDVVTHSFGQ